MRPALCVCGKWAGDEVAAAGHPAVSAALKKKYPKISNALKNKYGEISEALKRIGWRECAVRYVRP